MAKINMRIIREYDEKPDPPKDENFPIFLLVGCIVVVVIAVLFLR